MSQILSRNHVSYFERFVGPSPGTREPEPYFRDRARAPPERHS